MGEPRCRDARESAWRAGGRAAAGARRVFYLALAAQRRVEIQEVWLSRVANGRELVEARVLAGDASALDALRAQRELRRARAARDRALAEQEATHARLESLLGKSVVLSGTMMPLSSPSARLNQGLPLALRENDVAAAG